MGASLRRRAYGRRRRRAVQRAVEPSAVVVRAACWRRRTAREERDGHRIWLSRSPAGAVYFFRLITADTVGIVGSVMYTV
jgi:hypothetical protein